MSILQAIILGIVQGLTEFLPVSSSGHLMLFQTLFDIDGPAMTFDVALHLGTLIPVLIIYKDEIIKLIRNPFQKLTVLLIAATIPAVVFALLFGDWIDALFGTTSYLAAGFFVTGVLLLFADTRPAGRRTEREMGVLDALVIGCMQGIAIAPAISRSGATITGALTRRLTRESAARFSFLMSIPAILGGAVLEARKLLTGTVETPAMLPMMCGVVAAMLSGYFAIRFMIRLIKLGRLRYFSYYVFLLGAFILADQLLIHRFL